MYYQRVELERDAESIYEKIGLNDSLMSKNDHGFLGGLLKKYRPNKILEIGVYAGGTTIAILDNLMQLGLNESKVYSVDLATTINRDKPVGYMINEAEPYLNNLHNHHLYTGIVAPQILEKIASDEKFDFAIIDTAHYLPGEILDFLACFPFMEKDAVVVLHDVMLNHKDKHRAAATKVVFDTVVGNKIWNWDMETYPNIAAIQLNEDTERYIIDLISSLSLSWYYNPGKEILEQYGRIIEKYYSSEAYDLYKNILKKSDEWWDNVDNSISFMVSEVIRFMTKDNSRLYIYGAGKLGKAVLRCIKKWREEKEIAGFIVSDGQTKGLELGGVPIYYLSEINYDKKTDFILNTLDIKEVKDNLSSKGMEYFTLQGIVKEGITMHI